MSLPPELRRSLNPVELEFLACQELISIIPSISMAKIAFISGDVDRLEPPKRSQTPIWMALNLKQKRKCHIVAPDWLSVDFLQQRLEEENKEKTFSELPFYYVEIAKVLLDVASDDLRDRNPDMIRSLLKDLREARQAKCRQGLENIDRNAMKLSNLSAMEINEIRPFFTQSVWVLNQLSLKTED